MADAREIVRAHEAVLTALGLMDGQSWRGTNLDNMQPVIPQGPEDCVTLIDLDRVRKQLPSGWFDGLYAKLEKVRAQLAEADEALRAALSEGA